MLSDSQYKWWCHSHSCSLLPPTTDQAKWAACKLHLSRCILLHRGKWQQLFEHENTNKLLPQPSWTAILSQTSNLLYQQCHGSQKICIYQCHLPHITDSLITSAVYVLQHLPSNPVYCLWRLTELSYISNCELQVSTGSNHWVHQIISGQICCLFETSTRGQYSVPFQDSTVLHWRAHRPTICHLEASEDICRIYNWIEPQRTVWTCLRGSNTWTTSGLIMVFFLTF